jgi:DNA-directed RNA polymerase subunit RPC12/RpoP
MDRSLNSPALPILKRSSSTPCPWCSHQRMTKMKWSQMRVLISSKITKPKLLSSLINS